jgi:uncharacterized protein
LPVVLETRAGGHRLHLLPQRAAYLPEAQALLIADAHIGKARSFRKLGVPVPEATTQGTLARLDAAIAAVAARGLQQLIFLGDMLHSAQGRAADTLDAVARWRDRHAALQLTLVRGNHDRHAGDPPVSWGVGCVDEPLRLAAAPGLALCHHPDPVAGVYVLAGHVHPAASIGGRAHDRLRLPCFHFGLQVGVLPAFGEFTGTHALPRREGDRVWVITPDAVLELPPTVAAPKA